MDQDHDIITQLLSRPDTWPGTFLGPPMTHYTLLLWRRSEPRDHLSTFILFRSKNDFWFPFDGNFVVVRVRFYPSPWSNDGTKYLFIQIDDYEWAILSRLSSRPWYIIVIFCGNPPKIHRHGTLAKTTKYSSSPENIGLATQNKLWSNDPKKPQDTKLWECSHHQAPSTLWVRSGRAPQPAINYNYHFRYQVIIGRNARTRPGKRALAMDNAHLLLPKYAWNARNCEICPELYWLSALGVRAWVPFLTVNNRLRFAGK